MKKSTYFAAIKVYIMDNFTVKKGFQNVAMKTFKSEAQSLDFSNNVNAADTINRWVEEKTNNKIKNLIAPESLNRDDRFVLVNALHFKGMWVNRFQKNATHKGPFYVNDQDTVEVDFMHTVDDFKYGKITELNASAIQLPYLGSNISMLMILPDSKTGLAELESKLHTIDIQEFSQKLMPEFLTVVVPKFKTEFDIDLNEPLEKVHISNLSGSGSIWNRFNDDLIRLFTDGHAEDVH